MHFMHDCPALPELVLNHTCHRRAPRPPTPAIQVNNAAAQRLFAGQLHVKMHMQQKGGSGGAKAKAARTTKKAGGDGGAAAAAAAGGGGQPSGRGAGGGGGYQQHQQHQQSQQQATQQQWHQPEDPIDLCDDDDEEDGSNSLRVTVVMKALMDLNAFLRKQRGAGRAPFQTVALQRVRAWRGFGAEERWG